MGNQRTRQAIVVAVDDINPNQMTDKLALFNEDGSPYARTTEVDVQALVDEAVGPLLSGADSSVDTFIEAYNRFLADESAAAALTTTVSGKVSKTGDETVAGVKTFSSAPVVPDASFAEAKVLGLTADLAAKETPAGAQSKVDAGFTALLSKRSLNLRDIVTPSGTNDTAAVNAALAAFDAAGRGPCYEPARNEYWTS